MIQISRLDRSSVTFQSQNHGLVLLDSLYGIMNAEKHSLKKEDYASAPEAKFPTQAIMSLLIIVCNVNAN